jgi:SAM-dependent methyltransferase
VNVVGRVARKLRSALADLRHGGYTGGIHATRYGHLGATHTVSTKHSLIPYLLGPVLQPGDVFVDIGCGRGRVLNWVLDDGRAAHVFGLEIEKRFAAEVALRHRDHDNVTVVAGDALGALPDAATLLYMWNPFDGSVMQRCKERIIEKYAALGSLPRIRVVYHHALFIDVWREDSRCAVRRIELPPDELNEGYLITFPN